MTDLLRKGIFFDLDTESLNAYYPVKSWNNAYADIERFLIKNGFEHTQGSGYHSLNPMSDSEAMTIIYNLIEKHPWLNKCVNVCTLNDVPSQHDITNIFDKSVEIEKRKDRVNENKVVGKNMKDYLSEIKNMRSQSEQISSNNVQGNENHQKPDKTR